MDRTTEQKLSDVYIANLDIISEGFPPWVNAARRGFLENFNLMSLPTTRDERYRHTDLHALFGAERELYFTPPADRRIDDKLPVDGCEINIVNGFCVSEIPLVTLDNGVIYGSLRDALSQPDAVAERYFNTAADNEKEEVTALNSLFIQDGAFVCVPRGVKAEKPFVINFEHRSPDPALFFDRVLIVLEEGAQADVFISHRSDRDGSYLVNFVRENIMDEGARLNLSEISNLNNQSALISGNYLRQASGSTVNMMNVWLNGGVTRVNARTDLDGAGCESNMYGLWFGTGGERADINMLVNHMAPDCNSFELVKGIVSGHSVGAFTGKVYVAPGAQRTVALQQSRNLQMSDAARIFTEPQLEIYADDVKCSHGATVGQTDTEAIYYMRQRGLSEQDARRLQMSGFVNDIISRCPHGDLCDFVAALAECKIAEL